MHAPFILPDYLSLFDKALDEKYGDTFRPGFAGIEKRYREIRGGDDLTIDDVMSIFDTTLPFVKDWTRPDAAELGSRMQEKKVARSIQLLINNRGKPVEDIRQLITDVLSCFRELGLTALVLHHVDPDRFAMCSYNLASILRITAPTVPHFYVDYCSELREWANRYSGTHKKLSVVEAEFALWTWYRFAFRIGRREDRKPHERKFENDTWVQEKRAKRIATSLTNSEKLDLARSYLHTSPTVTAIIAWRELETAMRKTLRDRNGDEAAEGNFPTLLRRLGLAKHTAEELQFVWGWRGGVTHEGKELKQRDASRVLDVVSDFIEMSS